VFSREKIVYQTLDLPDRMSLSNPEMLLEAEAYYDRMKRRHSVRDFNSAAVPDAVIQECIRTAGTAPSGANHQPWHFVAISDPDIKRQIRLAAEKEEKNFMRAGAVMNGSKRSNLSEPMLISHI